jgi:ubiquinone/menaquinone biosynthesis C-methylase UbiE
MYSRIFAAGYDLAFARGEHAGMADHRRALLAAASGRVLEIGAGTGLNLPHYPDGIELVLTEPEAPMARRLERRGGTVIPASAEALPFEDASFDTAVSTLVLCTVPDPERAVAELARVLKPGGRLLFIEHVRGEGRLARWQDRLERPWRRIGNGCHANRDTLALLRGRFDVQARRETWHRMPRLIRPLVVGAGVRT